MEELLRQLISCSICFEVVSHQKQLQCQHSICLICLQKLVRDKPTVQCPVCKKVTMIHNGGVAKIHDCLLIKQITDLLESHKDSDGDNDEDDQKSSYTVEPASSSLRARRKDEKTAGTVITMARILKRRLSATNSQVATKKARIEKVKDAVDFAVAEIKRCCDAKILSLEHGKLLQCDEIKSELDDCSDKAKRYEELQNDLTPFSRMVADGYTAEQKKEIGQMKKRLVVLQKTHKTMTGKKSGVFKKGDTVRLLPSTTDTTISELMCRDVSFGSVGIFVRTLPYKPNKAWVIFPEKLSWVGSIDQLVHTRAKASLPFKGDRVRVSLSNHFSREGSTRLKMIRPAILIDVESDSLSSDNPTVQAVVQYVNCSQEQRVPYENVKFFTNLQFEVGDRVRVNCTIEEPSQGWGKINGSSVGTIKSVAGGEQTSNTKVVVEFEEDSDWSGVLNDLELWMAPSVGDQVQVKLSVKEPCLKWGEADHSSKGTLEKITVDRQLGQVAEIQLFPQCQIYSGASRFKCLLSEIELARYKPPSADSSYNSRSELQSGTASVLRLARLTGLAVGLGLLSGDGDESDSPVYSPVGYGDYIYTTDSD